MSEAYIGEIRLVGFNFAPVGWAFCDGSLLSIADNNALFSLLGTTYGGDGQSTFALPDLRGRVPVHQGQGNSLSAYVLGQSGGVASVTLNASQLPAHTHPLTCQSTGGGTSAPAGQVFAGANTPLYATPGALGNMTTIVAPTGGSQQHDNMQPFLAANYIISLYGIYPTQN